MGPFGAALILLIIFGSITTLVLGGIYLRNKNKERMAILSHGADPNLFKEEFKPMRNINLKLGILLISIAVGILVGYALAESLFIPEAVAYFASIFMCGGLGLLIGVFADKAKDKK